MMNKSTWDLVSECRLRRCRKLSAASAFALLGTIAGRGMVAPITWVVFSLLQGQAYTCAFSEFVDPDMLEGFPSGQGPKVMAKFPCRDSVPTELQSFSAEIERRLKYESQRTAGIHAHMLAAETVKSFFGFVALEPEEKEQLAEHQSAVPICSTNWNRVTGVYLYRENKGLPLYSRLNKWATYSLENNVEAMEKEMDVLS